MASDGGSSNYFGFSVSIFGDYAIIGSYGEDAMAVDAGAAYVFKKNSTGQFEEVNKLMASDADTTSYFGYSVSISGDYAIVGANYDDRVLTNAGAAYVFKKNSTGQFEEVNKLMVSDAQAEDNFGNSVSISGDYAIVGARYEDAGGSDAGAAYVFKKNSTGQFEEVNKLMASDAQLSDQFGNSVSISGDYAIVGAYREDTGESSAGAAYIFEKNSTGQYEEVNKLMASDAQAGDYFGGFVSISGDYAIIGAYWEDEGATTAGAAYIFKKNLTGQYEELNKIMASDAQEEDLFGYSVSISENYAVVGANYEDTKGSTSGSAYIFNLTGEDIIPDTTVPTWLNASNWTGYANESVKIFLNASDEGGIANYSINDTSNFEINLSNYLVNTTVLSAGVYNLNITVNDTVGNEAYRVVVINVSTVPVVETEEETTSSGGSVPIIQMGKVNEKMFSGELKYGYKGSFEVKNESHRIYLREIDRVEGIAKFDVYSTLQKVKVKVGEEKEIDLDDDGVMDVVLKLNSIDEKKIAVDLELGEIIIEEEKIIEEDKSNVNDNIEEVMGEGTSSYLYYIAGLIVVVLVIIVLFLFGKKDNSSK